MVNSVCWRYGVIFCNSFIAFGFYYSSVIPTGVQNEIMYTYNSSKRTSDIRNQSDCKVCLGLGEVRYNVLFSSMRWVSAIVCLPTGCMVDRLGNRRSAILLNTLTLLGSILFTVGAISHAPTTTPLYVLMVVGRVIMAVGDGSIRLVQARVVANCFPGDTFIPLAFATAGLSGQGLNYFVTPNVATAAGFSASLWLGVGVCGFSLFCSVGLAFLLQKQSPCEAHDFQKAKTPTLTDIRSLPKLFWMYIWTLSLGYAPWICKQTNLPDYLKLQHDYKMTEAGYIGGVPCLVMLFAPVVSLLLERIDCNGVVMMCSIAGSVILYALLGFCPAIQPIIIAIADGVSITISSVIQWQLLVVISPATFIGTLGGISYMARHASAAFFLLVSGYVLEKPNKTDVSSALHSYQHFFLMLIVVGSIAVICAAVMNGLDIRGPCVLNTRIGKWRKSDVESTELMSGIQSSSKYS